MRYTTVTVLFPLILSLFTPLTIADVIPSTATVSVNTVPRITELPLALLLDPASTTCPSGSSSCGSISGFCCPLKMICLQKQNADGLPGVGCCTTAAGATCGIRVSDKCAIDGSVSCGNGKSTTCCEKAEMCRDTGAGGVWDCAGLTKGNGTATGSGATKIVTATSSTMTTGTAAGTTAGTAQTNEGEAQVPRWELSVLVGAIMAAGMAL